MEGFVYILQSDKNGSYYVGSTVDVQHRLFEHNSGKTPATRYLVPWVLVFVKTYQTLQEARKIEYKIKKLKSRKILERIIADGTIKMKGP